MPVAVRNMPEKKRKKNGKLAKECLGQSASVLTFPYTAVGDYL